MFLRSSGCRLVAQSREATGARADLNAFESSDIEEAGPSDCTADNFQTVTETVQKKYETPSPTSYYYYIINLLLLQTEKTSS